MASRDKIFLDTDAVAIVTRNKTDYSVSALPVLAPDEFLAQLKSQAE